MGAGVVSLAIGAGMVLVPDPATASDHTETVATASASSTASRMGDQAAFIRSQQRSSGAILHGSGGINPYFGNFAALGLLEEGSSPSIAAADRWLGWVLAHLNIDPTIDGGRHTIYDYAIVGGQEVSRGTYDSVDSYAATTLTLANALWKKGDESIRTGLAEHVEVLEKVARLLDDAPAGVRKPSGLTQATFTYNVAFLMDNAEVYQGLRDFAEFESALGRLESAATYNAWAEMTRGAILGKHWNSATKLWSWHDSVVPNLSGPFYAQSMAQYYPVLFGVVDADDSRAVASWTALSARWPEWRRNDLGSAEAATPMAYAAALMGDTAGARAMVDDIDAQYAPGWHYPTAASGTLTTWWSPAQAGWYIRTLALLESAAH
ncbi:hypothetical protein ACI2IX_10330 [Leifsonia aquatica]|uniref:hypothetical protein n=1 Tax=Leifsonia aquatica TaxID=144185 RepID=UPI00384CA6AC